MNDRVTRLRRKMAEQELDAILISQPQNRRYLSGFTGSAGLLLISQQVAVLATDFRYTEQAESQAPAFRTSRVEGGLAEWLPGLLSPIDAKRVGFEASGVSFSTYQQLAAALGDRDLVPTEAVVESLRAVKGEDELEPIRRAVRLADDAFDAVSPAIRSGMTEKQVAWELERTMREMGSESMPFDIIVASGPNAALPHHRPGDRAIQRGEPVVIDMGARVDGYCSDLSRTVYLGQPDGFFGRIYHLVLEAQLAAMAGITEGMSGNQADALARTTIAEGGHGEDFGHGLGHGIGLHAHEQPRLGKGSADVLADGMVFTIEPGIYISGWGGVRIEDVAVLENGKPRVLSRAGKLD